MLRLLREVLVAWEAFRAEKPLCWCSKLEVAKIDSKLERVVERDDDLDGELLILVVLELGQNLADLLQV